MEIGDLFSPFWYSSLFGARLRHSVAVFAWRSPAFHRLLHYSSQIYPELVGAVLTVLALLQLRTQLTIRSVMVAGICAGLLPLFSARYWLLALPILIVVAARLGRGIFSGKRLALFVPVIALPLAWQWRSI